MSLNSKTVTETQNISQANQVLSRKGESRVNGSNQNHRSIDPNADNPLFHFYKIFQYFLPEKRFGKLSDIIFVILLFVCFALYTWIRVKTSPAF